MVAKAKEYIAAGDAFQVVLSQRFTSRFDLPAFSLYRALRRVNPVALPLLPRFRRLPDRRARARKFWSACATARSCIRPIAGTRRRGATQAEDEALAAELLADPKERAEHLMLLDLGRNDVGRVAKIGTVKVTDSFFIERYSHVMHIVSNVEGELRDDLDAIDALAAGFPAGTVSGAPKVRAMEIIDELEKDKRGIYAGCIGYFGAGGEMDTCIVLRASVVKDGICTCRPAPASSTIPTPPPSSANASTRRRRCSARRKRRCGSPQGRSEGNSGSNNIHAPNERNVSPGGAGRGIRGPSKSASTKFWLRSRRFLDHAFRAEEMTSAAIAATCGCALGLACAPCAARTRRPLSTRLCCLISGG